MYKFGDPNQHRTRLSRPSFTEFIQYIINEHFSGNTMDMHWEPVYKFCTPCQFKFSHILKMETFDRDQEFILEKAGVNYIDKWWAYNVFYRLYILDVASMSQKDPNLLDITYIFNKNYILKWKGSLMDQMQRHINDISNDISNDIYKWHIKTYFLLHVGCRFQVLFWF